MTTTKNALDLFRANEIYLLLSDYLESLDDLPVLPLDAAIAWPEAPDFLDNVGVCGYSFDGDDTTQTMKVKLLFATEIMFGLPGLEDFALVIGRTGGKGSGVSLSYTIDQGQKRVQFGIEGSIALRFARDVLKPVVKNERGGWQEVRDAFAELRADLGLAFNGDGSIDLGKRPPTLGLGTAMIGDSGFVVEINDVVPVLGDKLPTHGLLDNRPAEVVDGWRGLYIKQAKLFLPEDLDLVKDLAFTDCYLGSGGFTGALDVNNRVSGTLFGMAFTLDKMGVAFRQNALTKAAIAGEVTLPFFDKAVKVDVGFDLQGNLTARLGTDGGACTLKHAALDLTLRSLAFTLTGGKPGVSISGSLKPKVGNLDWPSFDVKELVIDAEGNVHLDGGWQDLPKQYALDFNGFKMEITKLGFGKAEDGRNWIGFSGGIKLTDGFPAGASVEGLRILWDENGKTDLTFNGVGVEFEVPKVLRFKGAVAYNSVPGAEVTRFDGAIKLELLALQTTLDAQLVFGSHTTGGYSFFAIYVGVELPAGIPLWATGLGLYGMAGLFALNMQPNKQEQEPWYGMGAGDGWYKRDPVGVNNLQKKWEDRQEALALGTGVTIGTLTDGGYNFSGKLLLVIVFPGPILLIEGKANLLKKRAELDKEPNFRALAVLDARAGTFLFGLDAQYKYTQDKGDLIDIRGSAEAFFSLNDPERWHLYIGKKEPKQQRIRAHIVKLFEANAYFMLDARHLATGAWIGYAKEWKYSVVSLALEAWLDTHAVLSWKPVHFHGELWLHGKVALRALFVKLALVADARFEGDVPDPFHLLASLRVAVDLPWPLPDFEAELKLEWGPEPKAPPLPLPLKEVAVEHLKATTSWPLARSKHLLPNYDDGDGYLVSALAGDLSDAPPPQDLPRVPVDGRPHLTFNRPVHDYAGVAAPRPHDPPWEYVGDPQKDEGPIKVRYWLKKVVLDKWVGGDRPWQPVACAPKQGDVPLLYGSWAPVPGGSDGDGNQVAQTKLWLWSKTPFDYTRHGSTAWEEWFTRRFADYPCLPPPKDRVVRCDFENAAPGAVVHLPHAFKVSPEVELQPGSARQGTVDSLTQPLESQQHALRVGRAPGEHHVVVSFAEAAKSVELAAQGTLLTDQISFLPRNPLDPHANPAGDRVTRSQSVVVECFDANGQMPQRLPLQSIEPVGSGVYCGDGQGEERVEVTFFIPVSGVELTLTVAGGDVEVVATDGSGMSVHPTATWLPYPGEFPHLRVVRLIGDDLVRVKIRAPQGESWLHAVRFTYRAPISAFGVSSRGRHAARIVPGTALLKLATTGLGVEGLKEVHLHGEGPFHLARVRAVFPPRAQDFQRRRDVAQHRRDELARWAGEDDVLEPETTYRLTVVTAVDKQVTDAQYGDLLKAYPQDTSAIAEYAYFRTAAPPGVLPRTTTPKRQAQTREGQGALDDLTLYVRQTMPPTVPAPGEQPPLPRPVYRAYDVGIAFNENYVDLMYRLARRDLALYLYDQNNRPVRDAQGRLVLLPNRWGRTERLYLSQTDERTVATYNGSSCAWTDPSHILRDRVLTCEAPGAVLEPDSVYEARLVPLLLHEDFEALIGKGASGNATLGEWRVVDLNGASKWQVVGHEGAGGDRIEAVGTAFELDAELTQVRDADDRLILLDASGREHGDYLIAAVDKAAHTVSVKATPALGDAYPAWKVMRAGTSIVKGRVAKPAGGSLEVRKVQGVPVLKGVEGGLDVLRLHKPGADSRTLPILSVNGAEGLVTVKGRLPEEEAGWNWEIPGYAAATQSTQAETLLLNERGVGSDFRLRVLLRTEVDDDRPAGLAFRHSTSSTGGTYYLLRLDPQRGKLRLEHRQGRTLLKTIAESDFAYEAGRDYLLTVEAVGPRLAAYVDGQQILTGEHEELKGGAFGLYSGGNATARFSDVRVDDLGPQAPVAYAFKFTTSKYAGFYHHLHSYQDEVWPQAVELPANDLASFVKRATAGNTAPADDETKGYEALIAKLYTPVPHQPPSHLEVTRVNGNSDGHAFAFLVRSPEPLDWTRTRLRLERADASKAPTSPPGAVKLTEVTFGKSPHAESVTLLLREATVLSGYRVDYLHTPEGAGEQPTWKTYYTFAGEKPLPAGTRVRIFAGDPRGAPDPEPGLEQRFVAPDGAPGHPALDEAKGARMRVVPPEGHAAHSRHFWPQAKYATEKVNLLRKADGTAFFVFVPATLPRGASLKPGDYRLELTYRRRNTGVDSQSPVLSQAGNTLPERVTLDIPWKPHEVP